VRSVYVELVGSIGCPRFCVERLCVFAHSYHPNLYTSQRLRYALVSLPRSEAVKLHSPVPVSLHGIILLGEGLRTAAILHNRHATYQRAPISTAARINASTREKMGRLAPFFDTRLSDVASKADRAKSLSGLLVAAIQAKSTIIGIQKSRRLDQP